MTAKSQKTGSSRQGNNAVNCMKHLARLCKVEWRYQGINNQFNQGLKSHIRGINQWQDRGGDRTETKAHDVKADIMCG